MAWYVWALIGYLSVGLIVGIVEFIRADDKWDVWFEGVYPILQIPFIMLLWGIVAIIAPLEAIRYFITKEP